MRKAVKILILFAIAVGVLSIGTKSASAEECDNFLPKKDCTINVEFGSGVHEDVAVLPGNKICVVVSNKPPFASCSVTASPSALTRDLSSSIGSFLTTLGGLGAIGSNPKTPKALPAPQGTAENPNPPNEDAKAIEEEYNAAKVEEAAALTNLQAVSGDYKSVQDQIKALWSPTNDSERYVSQHIGSVKSLLIARVNDPQNHPEPSIASAKVAVAALNDSVAAFRKKYAGDSSVAPWLVKFSEKLDDVNGVADTYADYVNDLLHAKAGFKQALDELRNAKPLYTSQTINLRAFSNKQVALTLSCKDDITSSPSADNIVFTAYYVKLPIFDLSAGVIFTLLGRHQIGVVGPTAAQNQTGQDPNGTFAVTDSSKFQVIPMALVELHTRGFKCGNFVCNYGGVIGAGPNNAAGSTVAEFFEGASFAVQRVSFLFGFHDGRVEELGGGYKIGDPPPSSGYSPIITRAWTVHPAFGITYRIPLR